jgi:hypothetical protein
MPASPGGILPRDMDSRQWNTFLTQSGIQADRTVKAFTPTWDAGDWTLAPTGDINYYDFGAFVVLWLDASLGGFSNSTEMTFTGLPTSIRPSSTRVVPCLVVTSGVSGSVVSGSASIFATGEVIFQTLIVYADPSTGNDVLLKNGFSGEFSSIATDVKGLPAGWLVMYPK